MWEQKSLTVKELGSYLYLDSGTLTPLLKKMEVDGLISRNRDSADERNVIITLTNQGMALREKAVEIPAKLGECISLSPEDAGALYAILYKLLGQIGGECGGK
jgi:MarR family transcriptional regulator, organic hydroperoxide resistance regulator